jgi:hypothetical protein
MSKLVDAVTDGVNAIIFETVPESSWKIYDINGPDDIEPRLNLGLPAPIGMAPLVIKQLVRPLNKLIKEQRTDHSARNIKAEKWTKVKKVGDVYKLVIDQVNAS